MRGISVFPHLAHYRHYSLGLLSRRGSVSQTTPKLPIENNERKRHGNTEELILFHAQGSVPAAQPGLQVDRTSANAAEERSATHLVYDVVKVNGFVWICT